LFVADPTYSKEKLFETWHTVIVQLGHAMSAARKPAKYLLEMQQTFAQVKRYADFFGYELPIELVKVAGVENLSQFVDYLKEERQIREAKEKKERRKRLNAQKKHLADWRSFKVGYLRTYDGLDYLRFEIKTGQVETTQGVRFPISAGHQLYKYVLTTNANGGCKNCGKLFLDRYTIIEINKNFIHIGCHKVTLKEIRSFAKQQGWE